MTSAPEETILASESEEAFEDYDNENSQPDDY